jgi:hypothetical protein
VGASCEWMAGTCGRTQRHQPAAMPLAGSAHEQRHAPALTAMRKINRGAVSRYNRIAMDEAKSAKTVATARCRANQCCECGSAAQAS